MVDHEKTSEDLIRLAALIRQHAGQQRVERRAVVVLDQVAQLVDN